MSDKIYRTLQKHLNSLPVGYPRTITGVEIKLLKRMFDPLHAEIALSLSFRPEKVLMIYQMLSPDLKSRVGDPEGLETTLMEMASRGSIMFCEPDQTFALVPFIVGMYEFQLNKLSNEFLDETVSFGYQGFGLEYLTTYKPQSRVIPLDIRIDSTQKVSTYDEYRSLIRASEGRIAVLPCICRTAADARGNPCRHSDERELCLALRDYADMAVREGIGRSLTVDEALALAERNQEAGLVLQSTNDQNPQFICACCDDCCGLLGMIKASPAPADHIASAYRITVVQESCVACGLCVKKCPMDALSLKDLVLLIDDRRCIGCGVCTGACPKEALVLKKKPDAPVPPETMEDLHNILERNRSTPWKKLKLALRIGVKMGRDFLSKS